MKKLFIGVVVVAVVVVGYGVSVYNRLVSGSLAVDNAWAQVETQYQRRVDLIPNLVSSTKGLFAQEQEIFLGIAEARQGYLGARTVDEKVAAASRVEASLSQFNIMIERYPQLRSAEAVQNLMVQLEGTENRVSVERGRFNDAVTVYNGTVKKFPTNIFAGVMGFSARELFEAKDGAENAPVVEL